MPEMPVGTDIDNCYVTPSVGVGRVRVGDFLANPTFSGGSANDGVATAGSSQATATPMTGLINNVSTTTAGQGVGLPVSGAGMIDIVLNTGTAAFNIFPAKGATDTINTIAGTTGVSLGIGSLALFAASAAGTWEGMSVSPKKTIYNTNTMAAAGTLTASNIVGASDMVAINITGSMTADAAVTLPAVTAVLAAKDVPSPNTSYTLRVINSSAGNKIWTVTKGSGWTLAGTATVGQNAWRDFSIEFTSLVAATITNIGGGTL